MNKDQISGKAKELKGSVKQTVGEAIDSPRLEAEGLADKARGKIQKGVGDLKSDPTH